MLSCSFCGKRADTTGALLAGPDANICDACIAVGQRTIEVRDALEAPLPSPETLSGVADEALLSQAAASCALLDRTRIALQTQIDELRQRHVGWTAIGTALGLSHQAAQERFG